MAKLEDILSALLGTPKKSWRQTAISDPDILEWWEQLRRDEKLPTSTNMWQHMEESARNPRGYNYPLAIESDLRPQHLNLEDLRLHWGGRTPSGVPVKGKKHKTRWKTDQD